MTDDPNAICRDWLATMHTTGSAARALQCSIRTIHRIAELLEIGTLLQGTMLLLTPEEVEDIRAYRKRNAPLRLSPLERRRRYGDRPRTPAPPEPATAPEMEEAYRDAIRKLRGLDTPYGHDV